MTRIQLGNAGGGPVSLDLDVLLRTRLLVQASSGGGKSWLLRRLMEQLFGNVQVLVIDPEGEFATLRERFDFVLAAPSGGDTPVTLRPRSPELLAHRLLELRSSAICDLYELPPRDRHEWVRRFLEALIDAPKKYWHGLVVVVDEAHVFAPEKGAGESVASDAMIGLATRGRKRGYCPVFATQRLGKLRKDAAAELLNVLIGQTFIDVDRKRAAEALGIAPADHRAFFNELRLLMPGKFWALGRAIATVRTLVTVGAVTTTHPEAGSSKHFSEPPPPSEKVKALLPKLADLPAEAEAKARSEAELRQEIAALKRELAARPVPEPAKVERVEVPVLKPIELRELQRACAAAEALNERVRNLHDATIERLTAPAPAPPLSARAPGLPDPVFLRPVKSIQRSTPAPGNGQDVRIERAAERKVLTVLAQYPNGRTTRQVAILAGYALGGGGFRNAVGRMRALGFIEDRGGLLHITEAGEQALGSWTPLPTGRALAAHWLTNLDRRAERETLSVLIDAYPKALPVDEIARLAGYEAGGGGFRNALGKLRTLELIEGRGELRASEELFG